MKEIIQGQILAKANHYLAVGGCSGRRIIKDDKIRAYEQSFLEQCEIYRHKHISSRFKLIVEVYHGSIRFDLDNSLKTLLDCLQQAGAITDDKLCFEIAASKHIDKNKPRVEFTIIELNEQIKLF